ncbi:MAG: T9SS type A sorting domain-containing protein [Saprospiraceae bacterium]|nr:T9SS type A sorting domain-containing protein [Saprospiraceae bacterium]
MEIIRSTGVMSGDFVQINVTNGYIVNKVGNQLILVMAAPLPVKLISFDAKKRQKQVVLDWVTASEINSDYFLIEKSADGINFQNIGKVTSKGTSDIKTNYQYIDLNPFTSQNYYRLVQYDVDGKSSMSETKLVNFSDDRKIRIWPTLVSDWLNIDGEGLGDLKVEIINSTGQLVPMNGNRVSGIIDVNFLAPGLYYLRTSDDQSISNYKFVKI